MGVGVILEPLVVVVLLFGGTWINRVTASVSHNHTRRRSSDYVRVTSPDSLESGSSSPTPKDGLLSPRCRSPELLEGWHKRHVGVFGLSFSVTTPTTDVFQDRLLSRLLRKLPFLVECWYWALVYWVSFFTNHSFLYDILSVGSQGHSLTFFTDISARACIYRRDPPGRHRRCRPTTCSTVDSGRGEAGHFLGAPGSTLLPPSSSGHDLD